MEQNPEPLFENWNNKPYDHEIRDLDELPVGFSDGTDVNANNLGLLARTYLGARNFFNMDWCEGITGVQSPVHRKPPPHG